MPSTLKDFIASQATRVRTDLEEARIERTEWIAAIERLLQLVEGWLADADPGGLLRIDRARQVIVEQKIGEYSTHVLTIALGSRQVRIAPVALHVAGPYAETARYTLIRAFGRVDLTNGIDRYLLFRSRREPEDHWVITDRDGAKMRSFERATFEEILQSLLE